MSKTVVVTGANRGIGLALVEYYRQRGDRVLAVCRRSSQELGASGAEVVGGVDLADVGVGEKLKQRLQGVSVDVLINNAGILRVEQLGRIDRATMMEQFQINALAPISITDALLGNLHSGSKVAFITSRMGSMADNSSGGYYGYRMSKAALNIAGVSLAQDLKPRGISVAILHPGYVQTAMVGFGGDISPSTAAERLGQRIDQLNLENSGSFWHSNGERLPW
jgi:NAD(P)-dependent dehydrogenase (short-subunit alcohol dehydrogenase family)